MTTQLSHQARVGIGIIGALLLTGCGAQHAAGDDKAGGETDEVVLTLADPDSHTHPAVQYFVDQVAELSDGTMRIDVSNEWGEFAPDAEQQLVRDVAAGGADVGVVWTHTVESLGVDAFRALNAPMLIDSYPLQQAVIDSDLSSEMLAELGAVGVTGVAVVAAGLERPFAVDGPLLSSADYEGITFTSQRSETYEDAIVALGANADVAIANDRRAGLTSGEIHGFEMNLEGYASGELQYLAPYATANVTLWADPVAVIGNPDTFADLTDEQRAWVLQAGAEATARSTDLIDVDADMLVELCESGARFADASESDLEAMRTAFAPVYDTLERDPQTADLIARIEQLKASTDPGPALEVPAECTGASPLAAPAPDDTAPSGDQSSLNGTYRWTLTEEDALAHGAPSDQTPEGLASFPWLITITLENGVWTLPGECDSADCTYVIDGNNITFNWAGTELRFSFTTDDDGTLQLQMVPPITNSGDVFVWTTKPWERID